MMRAHRGTIARTLLLTSAAGLALNSAAYAGEIHPIAPADDDPFANYTPLDIDALMEARGGFSAGGFIFDIGVVVSPPVITPVHPLPEGGPLGPSGPLPQGGPLAGGPLPRGGPLATSGGGSSAVNGPVAQTSDAQAPLPTAPTLPVDLPAPNPTGGGANAVSPQSLPAAPQAAPTVDPSTPSVIDPQAGPTAAPQTDVAPTQVSPSPADTQPLPAAAAQPTQAAPVIDPQAVPTAAPPNDVLPPTAPTQPTFTAPSPPQNSSADPNAQPAAPPLPTGGPTFSGAPTGNAGDQGGSLGSVLLLHADHAGAGPNTAQQSPNTDNGPGPAPTTSFTLVNNGGIVIGFDNAKDNVTMQTTLSYMVVMGNYHQNINSLLGASAVQTAISSPLVLGGLGN